MKILIMLPPTYRDEGLDILSKLKKIAPDMVVIMISARNSKMISVVSRHLGKEFILF